MNDLNLEKSKSLTTTVLHTTKHNSNVFFLEANRLRPNKNCLGCISKWNLDEQLMHTKTSRYLASGCGPGDFELLSFTSVSGWGLHTRFGPFFASTKAANLTRSSLCFCFLGGWVGDGLFNRIWVYMFCPTNKFNTRRFFNYEISLRCSSNFSWNFHPNILLRKCCKMLVGIPLMLQKSQTFPAKPLEMWRGPCFLMVESPTTVPSTGFRPPDF